MMVYNKFHLDAIFNTASLVIFKHMLELTKSPKQDTPFLHCISNLTVSILKHSVNTYQMYRGPSIYF